MAPQSTPTRRTGPRYAVVVLAAGAGSRVGSIRNKAYLPLVDRSVIAWSLEVLGRMPGALRCVLVIRPVDAEIVADLLTRERWDPHVEIVFGGDTRHASEHNALEHLAADIEREDIDVVLIHDGARPCVTEELAVEVAETALVHGGAFPGVELEDCIDATAGVRPLAGRLVGTQTPQAFRAAPLLAAYRAAAEEGFVGTDTASCVDRYSDLAVRFVPSDRTNPKITYPQDLFLAEQLLRQRRAALR